VLLGEILQNTTLPGWQNILFGVTRIAEGAFSILPTTIENARHFRLVMEVASLIEP
jgi:hypothetical protein